MVRHLPFKQTHVGSNPDRSHQTPHLRDELQYSFLGKVYMDVRNCEKCSKEHDGTFGSGRFCSRSCINGFATVAKREEINAKLKANPVTPEKAKRAAEGLKRAWEEGKYAGRTNMSVAMIASHRKRNEQKLAKWKAGELVPSEGVAKSLLILERGAKCEECGWSKTNPTSNTIPIELEHVDGDCYNNSYGNCKILCPNCHSLTPTYRGLNVNKGRGRRLAKVVSAWAKQNRIKLSSSGDKSEVEVA
jgi:hypothetical protein